MTEQIVDVLRERNWAASHQAQRNLKKASASEEFYIESSCGDPEGSEIAFFGGTVTAG